MTTNCLEWTLKQWLEVLENRHREEIKLGLDRILSVAQTLALDKPACKVITVAGTNGKGSTVSALETFYTAAGYRVGAYTSPHLLSYNERIRRDRMPIMDETLCQAFIQIEQARGSELLTFFETMTLAALWYFKQVSVDVIVLEVGLGGRLDATNIIDADLAIITTIDFDHQQFLGNTLDAIGAEKAGILRRHKPLIYADTNPPTSIVRKAQELEVPSYLFDEDYQITEKEQEWEYSGLGLKAVFARPQIQLKSAAAAITACLLLEKYLPVSLTILQQAVSRIYVAGRLEYYPGKISLLLDVSHNPQSARLLADRVRHLAPQGKVHAVFSALKDKDICGIILPLKSCVDHWYPAQLTYKRAASAEQLLQSLKQAEIITDLCYNNPLAAFQAAQSHAKEGDLIIVFGSFFTVSYVMSTDYFTQMQGEFR